MKAELVNKMQEIANGAAFDAKKVNEVLFDELVEGIGKSKTVAGEILRAVNRIQYRWYNDGDMAGSGYGRETVNPAVRYLEATVGDKDMSLFEMEIDKFFGYVNGQYVSDAEYDKETLALVETAIRYIAENKLWEKENEEDMLEYRDAELDVDRYDYDDEEDY